VESTKAEGSDCGLTVVLIWNLSGRTKDNHEKSLPGLLVPLSEFEPSTLGFGSTALQLHCSSRSKRITYCVKYVKKTGLNWNSCM
jgi:hypothetical protein